MSRYLHAAVMIFCLACLPCAVSAADKADVAPLAFIDPEKVEVEKYINGEGLRAFGILSYYLPDDVEESTEILVGGPKEHAMPLAVLGPLAPAVAKK